MKSRSSSASASHSPLRTVELLELLVLLWRLRRLNTPWDLETSGAEISGGIRVFCESSTGFGQGSFIVLPEVVLPCCTARLQRFFFFFSACVGTSEARLESVAESVALQ